MEQDPQTVNKYFKTPTKNPTKYFKTPTGTLEKKEVEPKIKNNNGKEKSIVRGASSVLLGETCAPGMRRNDIT